MNNKAKQSNLNCKWDCFVFCYNISEIINTNSIIYILYYKMCTSLFEKKQK